MTTVYRLPEEPPIGTVVETEADGTWTRKGDLWHPSKVGYSARAWSSLVPEFEPLVVVGPDPHPTLWTVGSDGRYIIDADREVVCKVAYAFPCILVCRTCAEDLVHPFGSRFERGQWATAHTAGTGHCAWFVLDGWPDPDAVARAIGVHDQTATALKALVFGARPEATP